MSANGSSLLALLSGHLWAGLGTGLGVFLTALALKALDDLLDEPAAQDGAPAWKAVYIGLLCILAAGLDKSATVSLFLAGYALGMVGSPLVSLPSGLPSWGESLGVMILAACLTGPAEVLGSLLVVMAVQAFDDYWDLAHDRMAGRTSLATVVGRRPSLTLALVLYVAAAALSPVKALPALAAVGALVVGVGRSRSALLGWGAGAGALGVVGTVLRETFPAAAGGAAGAAPLADGLGRAGWWGLLILGGLLVVVTGGGLVWAHRRGVREGWRRGVEAERASRALENRADWLDAVAESSDDPRNGCPGGV